MRKSVYQTPPFPPRLQKIPVELRRVLYDRLQVSYHVPLRQFSHRLANTDASSCLREICGSTELSVGR